MHGNENQCGRSANLAQHETSEFKIEATSGKLHTNPNQALIHMPMKVIQQINGM
jgi:hypothetical protein